MRWAMVAGRVDAGSGPTIERTGEAFLAARDRIERAKVRRERLIAHTGDPGCDALLADLAPPCRRSWPTSPTASGHWPGWSWSTGSAARMSQSDWR